MTRKKVFIQTDSSLAKTGFGRNAKAILTYLYKTGKYDLTHYCIGVNYSSPELKRTPWRSVGCLPDSQQEIDQLNRDPNVGRLAGYGAHFLDRVIKESKPDVYIGVQDIWGVDFAINKVWFNKINSVIWTTLDSLPILPSAVEAAKKVKNYWVWSSFAEKALHNMGLKNVETVHGAVDSSLFSRLPDEKRKDLRAKNGIPENAYIVGFVFRNQLRKSVPNLLEGFKEFTKDNPKSNAYLLLHTSYGEGWNIQKLAGEYKVDRSRILTTYICSTCKNYEVKVFTGQEQKCKFCSSENSQHTTSVNLGVSESQLNEVYNFMDVYCHPFTSGGQEIPIQEAKFTELITLVTNYSCGEEMCQEGSGSIPLAWSEYREHGTEFRKASTTPASIAKQLEKVYLMGAEKKRQMEKEGRQWAITNFSVAAVGKKLEDFIDKCEPTSYDFSLKEEERDPKFEVPEIADPSEWLVCMYHNILKMRHVDKDDAGHKHWMQELSKGMERKEIEKYFKQVALKENAKNEPTHLESILGKDDAGKRVLYVMPESAQDLFLSTSLFRSIKETYPDFNLYVATKPEYAEILDGNPYVYKVLPFLPQMENLFTMEGVGTHKGYFEIAFLPHITTQKMPTYSHNGIDKISYKDLKYAPN